MEFTADALRQHIPSYLTTEDKKALVEELNTVASGGQAGYFLSPYNDKFGREMLQGDGWQGLPLFNLKTGKVRRVRGIVLSNSCDIAPDNQRDFATRLIFTPLVKLSAYEELLGSKIPDPQRISDKLASIKAQKVSNIFFLPKGEPLAEDYIARFDLMQSAPMAVHLKDRTRKKLFTLSNIGFYMLIFKLSIHFCRFGERINRN